MQSRGQTVNLSESSKIESLSILHGIARNYTDRITRQGGPNARPCTSTAGFRVACVLLSRRIKRLRTTTIRRHSDPWTDKWAASRAEWQIEAPDSSGWGEITRRPTAPSGTTAQHFSVEVSCLGRREITAMKSILSFYAYVVFPRRVMRTLWSNRQIRVMFRKENVRITYTEVTAV